jgi:hypothetical protein
MSVPRKESDNDKPANISRKAIMLEQKLKVFSQITDNECQVNTDWYFGSSGFTVKTILNGPYTCRPIC